MIKYPNAWKLRALYDYLNMFPPTVKKGDIWIPARPTGFPSLLNRFKFAVLVLKGEADIVIWPEDVT